MSSIVLPSKNHPQLTDTHVYMAAFLSFFVFCFYFASKAGSATMPDANEIKIWLLAGGLTFVTGLLAYFLRRTFETAERKAEQLSDKLGQLSDRLLAQNELIARAMERYGFLEHRISNLEKRTESRK